MYLWPDLVDTMLSPSCNWRSTLAPNKKMISARANVQNRYLVCMTCRQQGIVNISGINEVFSGWKGNLVISGNWG